MLQIHHDKKRHQAQSCLALATHKAQPRAVGGTREDFEEGGLASPIGAQHQYPLPFLYLQFHPRQQGVLQPIGLTPPYGGILHVHKATLRLFCLFVDI